MKIDIKGDVLTGKKIAVALDVDNIEKAKKILSELSGEKIIIKVGYILFIKGGKEFIRYIKDLGFEIFLDLKLHDIPNTVYNGVSAAADLEVNYLTVHTLGGREMLQKAIEAKRGTDLKLLGVTVLTSHSEDYMKFIGSKYTVDQLVLKLAKEAINSGIDGIVCSAEEVGKIKKEIQKDFIAVVPGIRLPENSKDDQTRVATPETAIKAGADILVVGRPIIKSSNRKKTLKKFIESVNKKC